MTKKSFNVLIIEDDSSQGAALLEAVKRAGYNAEWTQSPQQALVLAHHTDFQLLIVDCMLPQKSGVDLINDLKPHLSEQAEIFLITGVFKDRSFIKDAKAKAGAQQFFIKPFNLETLIAHIDQAAQTRIEPEEDPIVSLYKRPNDQMEGWLKRNNSINALHLPILLKRIQESKCSGQLILNYGVSSSISFSKGSVFEVKLADPQSYFGILAVDKGYVDIQEVEEALKSSGQKPIGQLLIESLSLSPHAVNIILLEQVALRLSQLVQDQNCEITWLSESNPKEPKIKLSNEHLANLVLEWLPSKYDERWLSETLMRWGNYQLHWTRSVVSGVAQTIDEVSAEGASTTPHELFEALFLSEAFVGEKIVSNMPDANIEQKYQRALEFFSHANHFQILGISEKSKNAEIQRAFELLTRSFSLPEKGSQVSAHVSELANKVYNVIQQSYKILIDEAKRTAYIKEIQAKRHQALADLEPEFRAAILEIHAGHFENAASRLDLLVSKKAVFKDLKAYRIWAHIKASHPMNFEAEFDQIPPEGRYSAVYMFVRGLFFNSRLQYGKAIECFKNAIVLDPRMTEPKFELAEAEEAYENTHHTRLVREVKGAIGTFLGKKKPKKSA